MNSLKDKSLEHSKFFYELARKSAQNLESNNPTRVGLLINYSIFMAYNLKNPEAAISMIKFGLHTMDTSTIQSQQFSLLQQNISIWRGLINQAPQLHKSPVKKVMPNHYVSDEREIAASGEILKPPTRS